MTDNYYDIENFSRNYLNLRENKYSANELVEKPNFLKLLPDVKGKRILDIGCGYGNFTKLISDMGPEKVVGIDVSEKMINLAKAKYSNKNITYNVMPAEKIDFNSNSFDVVISNLMLHYIEDISTLFAKINTILSKDGYLVFSAEHPTSTASYNLGWQIDELTGEHLYWRLDNYGIEGKRATNWMEHVVVKYHRTIEGYCGELLNNGFGLEYICEAVPALEDIQKNRDLKKYLKRPLYLIIKAKKREVI